MIGGPGVADARPGIQYCRRDYWVRTGRRQLAATRALDAPTPPCAPGRCTHASIASHTMIRIELGARIASGACAMTNEQPPSHTPVTTPTAVTTGWRRRYTELIAIHTPASTCPPSRTGQVLSWGTALMVRMPLSTSIAIQP